MYTGRGRLGKPPRTREKLGPPTSLAKGLDGQRSFEPTSPLMSRTSRVLVVEDDAATARVVKNALSEAGFEVEITIPIVVEEEGAVVLGRRITGHFTGADAPRLLLVITHPTEIATESGVLSEATQWNELRWLRLAAPRARRPSQES